jgi:hypothetical protein
MLYKYPGTSAHYTTFRIMRARRRSRAGLYEPGFSGSARSGELEKTPSTSDRRTALFVGAGALLLHRDLAHDGVDMLRE